MKVKVKVPRGVDCPQCFISLFQINKLFKQVLRSLLDLHLRRFSIRRRLTPAIEILSRELQRFHGVLYPESFNRFLTDLWTAVAQVGMRQLLTEAPQEGIERKENGDPRVPSAVAKWTAKKDLTRSARSVFSFCPTGNLITGYYKRGR